MKSPKFYPELSQFIEQIREVPISEDRKMVLKELVDYVQDKFSRDQPVHLNFICTHNSRRSQFSQIWAKTAAYYYGIPIHAYSGGVEVTAFNERAVASIERSGFHVEKGGNDNPLFKVWFSPEQEPIRAYSKLYDDPENAADQFAAVMTCSHADENCPFIPGTEKRISVTYEDPKAFDGSPMESEKYDERSVQISSEMFYVFSQIK